MHLLVTGGMGFAMAHVVRQWLLADPSHVVTVVDLSPPDAVAGRFFAAVSDRMRVITGDLRRADLYDRLPASIDAVVHGAAATPSPYIDADGRQRSPEADTPLEVLDINIMATARLLDWWRKRPGSGWFVNLSSGAVYARSLPMDAPGALFVAEDQHVAPDGLYGVSKLAGEQIARRFGVIHRLPVVSLRLSGVFGAMDRITALRRVRCIPQVLAVNALAGRTTRVASLQAAGDFVAAADVARAVVMILQTPPVALRHPVYNIAAGALTSVAELAALIGNHVGECRLEVASDPEISQLPNQRTGRFAAYDIARAAADFGWTPRPLAETLADYVGWVKAEAAAGTGR